MLSLNEQLEVAIEIATSAHRGQLDKSGKPYILHPLYVMSSIDDIKCKIIAVLHDVIEDTWVNEDDLRVNLINEDCIEAILLLTRKENQYYMNYIKEISSNFYATRVKLKDLEHNMDLKRLNREPNDEDLERNKKYQKAYYYLLNN